eukprot:COSAG06_NODE_1097_length_10715_cov_3.095610_1_plen_70_part_00
MNDTNCMYVSTQVNQGIGLASADVFSRELCEEIGIPTFSGTRHLQALEMTWMWYMVPVISALEVATMTT